MMKSISRWALLLGLALAQGHEAFGQAPMPNIVYILADDMGFGDIRSYNPTSKVNTPNIDRIANAGMRFTNGHSLDSVCTLSRYGILTGQYGWRSSLPSGVLAPFSRSLIPASRLTVAEVLKSSGYSTGMFGKWHLGLNWATTSPGQTPNTNGSNVDFTKPFSGGPTDQGFDTFFGVSGSTSEGPYGFLRNDRVVGQDLVTPCSSSSPENCPVGQVRGNPYSIRNVVGPLVPGYDITNTLPTVGNEAAAFISSQANQANPFFAYVPLTAPHEPILPPSSAIGQSGVTGTKQAYGDFLWSIDHIVGHLLDTLEDPNHDGNTADSVTNNTLVVFTADNGVDPTWGFSSSPGTINGVPLRGGKTQVYEAGTRVPLLAQWPAQVPGGTVNNHLILQQDLMATVASMTGFSLPTNAGEDSVNILPELQGSASSPVRTVGVTHSQGGAFSVRQRDGGNNEWKLIFTPGNGNLSDTQIVNPTYPIVDFTKLQLYNLTADPGEQTNLLSGGGTSAMRDKALQLQQVIMNQIVPGRSTALPPRTSNTNSVMLIDFGSSSRQTAAVGWNNVTATEGTRPETTMGLYDEGGGYMGIVLKTSWVGSGADSGVASLGNAYNGPYPSQVNVYPSTALSDGFYVRNGNLLTISLESLDAHATYDLLFYGAASYGPQYTLFTITGSTVEQMHISPLVNNSTQVAAVDGMMADGFGRIRIDVEGRYADGSVGGSGWINFLKITEHLLEIPGDFNGDRTVNDTDYLAWRSAYGTVGSSAADGNHDGTVDGADYILWRRAISNPFEGKGDFNGDGTIDVADYTTWRNNFGSTGSNPADANGDQIVDSADYVIWRRSLGSNGLGSASDLNNTPTVPEPSACTMIVLEFSLLIFQRWYRPRSRRSQSSHQLTP